MSGLEQAAMAFDTDSGSAPAASESRNNDASTGRPTEAMFGRIGELEVDETSPARGGGDDLPVEGERKPAKARQQPDPDEEDDEDLEEGVADDEGDDEGDDEPDEEDDDPSKDDVYQVMVDGVQEEVSLREALNGYIRTKTFNQRLNELDTVKQAVDREASKVVEDRRKYIGLIEDMQKHLELIIPKEPDWDAEYAKDPKVARELQKRFDEYKAIKANLSAEKARTAEEGSKDSEERREAYIARENKRILANNPGWSDEKVRTRDQTHMADTAMRAGFALEEVQGITDSRMVTILLKAAKWDKLQADRPKPVRRGTKPVTPGAGSKRTAPKGGDKAMRQLSKTGRVEDAASVFTNLINRR